MWLRCLSALLCLFPIFSRGQSDASRQVEALINEGNYPKAIAMADSLMKLEEFQPDLYFLHSKKGDAFYYLIDVENSLKSYLQALEQEEIREEKHLLNLYETTGYVGFCYAELGLPGKALSYYHQSLNQAIQLEDSALLAQAYFNVSSAQLKLGNLQEGIEMLNRAYEIDIIRKDTSALSFDLNALGYAHLQLNQTEKAIIYFKESIKLLENAQGNYGSLGTRYNNLSQAFKAHQSLDSALLYNQRSIDFHESISDTLNLIERWINRGDILNDKGNLTEAQVWISKAERLVDTENLDILSKIFEIRIEVSQKLDRHSEAVAYAQDYLRHAENSTSARSHYQALQSLAKLLSESDSKLAYAYLEKSTLLKDSIRSIEADKAANQLAIRYEVDKTQSENQILKLQSEVMEAELAQKRITNLWLIIIVTVVLLSSTIITYSLISRSKIKEQLLNSEISELRLQIKQLLDFKPEQSSISIEQLNKVLDDPLSDREFEVLQMAMTDKNNSEIAEKIFVSTNTVKYHLKNIYQKLGVSNRKEALKFAFQATTG